MRFSALFASASAAFAATIQFGAAPVIPLVGVPDPNNPNFTYFDFPAQANPNGRDWDTSSGRLILEVSSGEFARLTLTGQANGPDGVAGNGDDGQFRIVYDPAGAAGDESAVLIDFSSGLFDPIPQKVTDVASISGFSRNAAGAAKALPAPGVRLDGFTNNGKFGTAGPAAGPAIAVTTGPVPDPGFLNAVVSLRGLLQFSFAGAAAGDVLILPSSAVVEAQGNLVPEAIPAWPCAAVLAFIVAKCRRRLRIKFVEEVSPDGELT